MISLKKLHIKNFLSFVDQEFIFNPQVTTCIMGRNLTEDGQESNGSGKSAFQSAVELSLIGNISRKITKAKMVRRGTDSAQVMLEMFDNVNNETIAINRTIPIKGSEKLSITINDKPVEFATINDGNSWIENRVGINRQDLANYFIVNEINYVSFFTSPDSKKKALISRFSNADIVDEVFIKIQTDIDKIEADISSKERHIISTQTKIDILNEDLNKEIDKDIEVEKQNKINVYKEKIKDCHNNIARFNNELDVLRKEIDRLINLIIKERNNDITTLNTQIKTFSEEDMSDILEQQENVISKIIEKVNKVKKAYSTLQDDLFDIQSDISKSQSILKGEVECPNCKHHFIPFEDVDVKKIKEDLKWYTQELEEVKSSLNTMDKIKLKYLSEQQDENKKLLLLTEKQEASKRKKKSLENELYALQIKVEKQERSIDIKKRDIEHIRESIQYQHDLIEEFEKKIQEIEALEKDDSKEIELKKKIQELRKQLGVLNEEVATFQELLESKKEWTINFKAFKSFLANKKLKIIQDMINKFLIEMRCDYLLKLEGYRQLSNGDLSEKITPYIVMNGDICDYGEFSKGERARIDFATMITLQTLINETCDQGGLDILMCDEVMEGLDSKGLNEVLNSFNNTKKTAFITTHVVNDNLYDNVMIVEKINGISKLKLN